MPVQPHTWSDLNDFLTASILNKELYRVAGQAFSPTGVAFHAAKPVYASGLPQGGGPALVAGWNSLLSSGANFNYILRADTAAMFGSRMDANENGTIKLSLPYSGGGGASGPGGLALMSVWPFLSSGTGTVRAGIGPSSGTGPAGTGVSTSGNASNAVCPFAVDIVDLSNQQVGWVLTTQTSPLLTGNSLDTSGRCTRANAFWASVYLANGNTVSALPNPLSSWTANTVINAALLNGTTGIAPALNLLNMPPLLRAVATGRTTVPASTVQVVGTGATPTYDTYSKYSGGNEYTAPLKGLYLFAGFVPYDDIGTTHTQAGVQVNGTTNFWGPKNPTVSGQVSACAKLAILDLNASDTVQLITQQGSGSSQQTSASANPMMIVLYLGQIGAPSPLPVAPDIGYYFQAGTPGSSIPGLLNAHLANDLNFLCQRPYFLGSQSVTDTYTIGNWFNVTQDTVGGVVHNAAGDPWSGWDSTNKRYVAPVSGWYLAVQESFFALPNTTTGVAAAGFNLSASGTAPQDQYGTQNIPSSIGNGGGAALGIYYLRSGDWIEPVAMQTAGTTGLTTSVTGANSHFEVVYLGE